MWIGDTDAELLKNYGPLLSLIRTATWSPSAPPAIPPTSRPTAGRPALVSGIAQVIADVEKHFGRSFYLSQHYRYQTNRSDPGRKLTPLLTAKEDDLLPTRRVAQVWQTTAPTDVHQSPDANSPVLATLALGTTIPSIQEQAELQADGTWKTIGPWRTVVLADDRTGFVNRSTITPVAQGAQAFDRLNRGTLYEIDLAKVPPWPLPAERANGCGSSRPRPAGPQGGRTGRRRRCRGLRGEAMNSDRRVGKRIAVIHPFPEVGSTVDGHLLPSCGARCMHRLSDRVAHLDS